jgi:hypothetical protein
MATSPTKTDTSEEVELFGLTALAFGSTGRVEAQEDQGQRELVASDTLPSELSGGEESWTKLRSLGFVVGELVSSDPMFRYIQLPAGWKKKGGDHDMWSSVVDETGKERLSVFYKAAFYDRSAFMRIVSE